MDVKLNNVVYTIVIGVVMERGLGRRSLEGRPARVWVRGARGLDISFSNF